MHEVIVRVDTTEPKEQHGCAMLKRVNSSDASQVILCQDFAVMYPGLGGLCMRCVRRKFCEILYEVLVMVDIKEQRLDG